MSGVLRESFSLGARKGFWDVFLLTSLSPWRSQICVSPVSDSAPKAHTNRPAYQRTRKILRDAGSSPPPLLMVASCKRTCRERMCVKVLWWGPSSELIVCFLSHYYDRVFTEGARLRLHSTLLLVPQYKQPYQPGLLLKMKNTFSPSLFLTPSLMYKADKCYYINLIHTIPTKERSCISILFRYKASFSLD